MRTTAQSPNRVRRASERVRPVTFQRRTSPSIDPGQGSQDRRRRGAEVAPPCEAHPIGLDDRGTVRLTWRELAEREEGRLQYPGSRLLDQSGFNEDDGWGFDRLLKSAMLQRRWAADAEADQVLEWFHEQLTARGWELHSIRRATEEIPLAAAFYRRGSAGFVVVVVGRAADRPASMYWPSKWWPMKGFTTTLRSMTAPPKTLEPRTRFHVDRAEHAWPRDAGHATRTYMSAVPYREANRSQSADRSDSVLKIEHRYGTSRIVTFIPNPTMVLASATEWGSGWGRTGLAGTLPSKMPRLGRIGFALAAITRANGIGAIG
jgi:hypothetical protein